MRSSTPKAPGRAWKRTGQEIYDYFGTLIDERRDRTGRRRRSAGSSTAEIDGEKLDRDDILDILFLFLIAGLDTVSDSLTCLYAFLATHPEHRRQIVDDPSCISSAVEELAPLGVACAGRRAPSRHPRRRASQRPGGQGGHGGDCHLRRRRHRHQRLGDPFDVRFDRDDNRHIAFGGGVHRCLGSHLARRELRVVLREWHRRIPDYRIKPGHEQLEYPHGLRHVKDLMLQWD